MHTEMWRHPATQDNVATLRRRGAIVLPPAVGRLTGPDSGPGRLPEPADIAALALVVLEQGAAALEQDLVGRRVVISAGGTREPLDPVRYLGNRSSGKQGYALARVAAQRGADVTLVAAHTLALPDPAGVRLVHVSTAAEMRDAVHKAAADADVVVMAAAVADFRPANRVDHKIKKTDHDPDPVVLTRNADILVELVAARGPGQVIVGFAAETGDSRADVLDHARVKLKRKGADLIVVNAVGDGRAFEVEDNSGWLLAANGTETPLALGSKSQLAATVWNNVRPLIRP
jgi:phosphopantothenoylcysteine decarboxylase / phosphopantothenate---cysteine ligase